MSKNITLITGANQGIGYATAKALLLASEERHVLLGCRDLTKGEKAVSELRKLPIKGTVEAFQIDVVDDASVDSAAQRVEQAHGHLDTLIHNAGISSMKPGRAAARQIFEVNVVGVISVADAFLPLLKKATSPRMVFVSSCMGCMTMASDPSSALHFDFANHYRASKSAMNMLLVQYQQYQIEATHGFDPGMVATYFGSGEGEGVLDAKRKRGAVEPDESIIRLIEVLEGKWDDNKGKVISREYGVLSW